MKTTEAPKTKENVEHQNAIAIAKKILEIMGNDFFTIDQMRKKMVITKNNNHSEKLSWDEARKYLTSIMRYGLAEALPAVKDCYKIRLDHEFQLNYFDKQIDIRNEEIEAYKKIMQEIFDKDEAIITKAKATKKTAKSTKQK